MGDLHVTTEDLTATANSLDSRVQTLGGIRTQVFGAAVPAGAFGRIPGLGSHLDQIYTQHVSETELVLQTAKDGVDSAAVSLHATAQGFEDLEHHTAQHIAGTVPS